MDLQMWGWNAFFEAAFAPYAGAAVAGRVVWENRGHARVQTEAGEMPVTVSGALDGPRRPVTGDWVAVDAGRRQVAALLPRRTRLSRKMAGRQVAEQVLAANVDQLLLVTALDNDLNIHRLERYLLMAIECGVAPVVILNKSDLADDPIARLRAADGVVKSCSRGDIPVTLMCALDPGSVAQLNRYLEPGETAALAGSSGTGKSTIVNTLLGADRQPVQAVREDDHRGRHTTTTRELFRLPAGWLLIDTPGLRELEPWATPDAVHAVFADVDRLAADCRFRDCRHSGEPGCSVLKALRDGLLDPGRMASFHKLRAEMEHLRRRENRPAAEEYKRRVKSVHREMRRRAPRA